MRSGKPLTIDTLTGQCVIGFTGTRNGMSNEQWLTVKRILAMQELGCIGLHGDCVGADADFDRACEERGMETFCLPCTFDSMRAHCTEALQEPKPPMQRNRDIVQHCAKIIACPPNKERIKKGSGTWATIGFAEKAGKPLAIVYPDGTCEIKNL